MKEDRRESRALAGERLRMRASDSDRQQVVDHLRAGLDEGRLKMEEYLDRVGLAYEAVTYGDLAALQADLPAAAPIARRDAAGPAAPGRAGVVRPGPVAGLPTALKVLWTIWLTVVLINVVIWALVSITTASLIYPWPLWVAGPLGAALSAVSAGVSQIRRSRRPAVPRKPAANR